MWFFRKYSVSILNEKWEPLFPIIKIKHLPRHGELLYLSDKNYYRVINLVHNINNKQGVFILVELIDKQSLEKK